MQNRTSWFLIYFPEMLFPAVHVFTLKCDGILPTEIHYAGADLRQSSFTKIGAGKKKRKTFRIDQI